MDRPTILDTAKQCVCRDRQATYDTPEKNFERIAAMWAAYKGIAFTTADVAAMMALVKVARIATSPGHADNWVDLAGYAACGGECATESSGEAPQPGPPIAACAAEPVANRDRRHGDKRSAKPVPARAKPRADAAKLPVPRAS